MTHPWQPLTGQGDAERLQGLMRGMDRGQAQPRVQGLLGGGAWRWAGIPPPLTADPGLPKPPGIASHQRVCMLWGGPRAW